MSRGGSVDLGMDGDEADVVGRVEESTEEDGGEDQCGGAPELRLVRLTSGGGGVGGEKEGRLAAWHSHGEDERERERLCGIGNLFKVVSICLAGCK